MNSATNRRHLPVIVAVAFTVIVLIGAKAVGSGQGSYLGYPVSDCQGTPYLTTTSLGVIHREAAAGVLRSYEDAIGPCLNMSISS